MTLLLVGLLAGLLVGMCAGYLFNERAWLRSSTANGEDQIRFNALQRDVINAYDDQLRRAQITATDANNRLFSLAESRLNPPVHDGAKEPTLAEADAAYAEQEAVEHA